MLSGIYSAASALQVAELNQEVVASNLAHVNVPGYRRAQLAVETFENALQRSDAAAPQGHGSEVAVIQTDFSGGPAVQTGRPLDLAVNGDGFFVVQGSDGPLYTRNGVFQVSEDGTLVTSDGLEVVGEAGPIRLPTGGGPGDVTIDSSGAVHVRGAQVGRLRLVRVENPSQGLTRVGTTLFAATDDAVIEEGDVRVQPGAREQSNVSAVDELVQLIVAMRYHEAAQRAMKSLDEAVQQNTQAAG